MLVTNSKGVRVRVYSPYREAFDAEVLAPIEAGLSSGEVADVVFNLDAIADAVLEWHTEWIDKDSVWLPGCGYCSSLGDDPAEFWAIVADNER